MLRRFLSFFLALALLTNCVFGQGPILVEAGSPTSPGCEPCGSIASGIKTTKHNGLGVRNLEISPDGGPVPWGDDESFSGPLITEITISGQADAVVELATEATLYFANLKFNVDNVHFTGAEASTGNFVWQMDNVTCNIANSLFEGHSSTTHSIIYGHTNSQLEFIETEFVDLTSGQRIVSVDASASLTLETCYFANNTGDRIVSIGGTLEDALFSSAIRDVLFASNTVTDNVIRMASTGPTKALIDGCTSIIGTTFTESGDVAAIYNPDGTLSLETVGFWAIGANAASTEQRILDTQAEAYCGIHGYLTTGETCACPRPVTGAGTQGQGQYTCECPAGEVPVAPSFAEFVSDCPTTDVNVICGTAVAQDGSVTTDDGDEDGPTLTENGTTGSESPLNPLSIALGAAGAFVVLAALFFLTRVRGAEREVDTIEALQEESRQADKARQSLVSGRTTTSASTTASRYSVATTASSVAPRVRRNPDGSIL